MDPFLFNGVNKFIEGATEGPIKTFNKTWELVFGGFHLYTDKIQFKRERSFEIFKKQFKDEISFVPEENLQEPQISLLGPALEASKFYIEEESLSKMFAKLIASSMDNRKDYVTHHSFVEIIKQFSPNDAILLKHLSYNPVHPAAKFKAVINKDSDAINLSDSLIKDSPLDIHSTELSINNLVRLGLLKENFGLLSLTKPGIYDEFYKSTFYTYFSNKIKSEKESPYLNGVKQLLKENLNIEQVCSRINVEYTNLLSVLQPWVLDFDKGSVNLTAYGKSFIRACID
ncbi:DUF4393 domain-containing protein [Staphylococcus gallinarum]|uniref:DUF4393 domain-containing protein n=1 Tax=Staphylococcus gallinarum TaxID=1293 RepID=UPI000E67700A|nr:DUF4393 domain-containing protein [Staphylococcus gallinarum]MCD8872320.1 DUF4393 domain-containing protein [Staphylococcus gallinarum]MCD8910225.1 DUF4393 domain-containing protein [Staphylococcus gallinarum]MCW0984555.1 DUF4393 domain-containing protein [Staphylococcus gallinarum]MEB7040138.1 DUF4393 domain-containing protein [Staphylococcus gallinarum]RIO88475.1 DUF4393 domain-containing protein [Staphylococcus gallinarum]